MCGEGLETAIHFVEDCPALATTVRLRMPTHVDTGAWTLEENLDLLSTFDFISVFPGPG